MANKNGNKTFVTITNMQIYKEFCEFKSENEIKHNQMLKDFEVKHNELLIKLGNYQSKITNLKMAMGGIGVLAMATLGWLILHLSG